MPRAMLQRRDGFSGAGVLAVMVAVAVLGAVAVPGYAQQRDRTHDRAAQSRARDLVRNITVCHARTRDYAACNTAGELRAPGLTLGSGPGQASITEAVADDFVITARSRSGNAFKVTRTDGGALVRSCSAARRGACAAGGIW